MAQPITWRNVSGPSPAEASRPLELARQTLVGSFDALGGILSNQEGIQTRNMLSLDEAAKQSYLDQLAGAKTPEELAALQASGALDTARTGLSAQARAAIRGADEARNTSLRQGVTASNEFLDKGLARVEAPEIQGINADIAAGNIAGARARIDAANIRDKAPLYAAAHAAERARLGETRADAIAPLTLGTAQRADEAGRLALEETKRTTAEAERQRGLDTQVADFSAAHQASTAQMRESIDTGLLDFPNARELPRNSDGSLAVDRMPTALRTAVNAHLATKELPSVDEMVGNDTAAKGRLVNELRKAGAKPADIARIEPTLGAAVSTSAAAPVGQEADAAARTQRILQAEEAAVNDQFGTVTSQGQSGALMEAGKAVIAEVTNSMTGGRERYTTALSKFLGKGGIPVEYINAEGKKSVERVLPSEDQLRRVLGQISTGWFRNTEADVGDLLENWAKSAEAQEGAKKVLQIRDRNRILGIDPLGKK